MKIADAEAWGTEVDMSWAMISSWDWQLIATCVIAFAALVYTGGTFLLWKTTQKSVEMTRQSVELARDVFKLNFLMAVHEVQRPFPVTGKGLVDIPVRSAGFLHRSQTTELLKRHFPDLFEWVTATEQEKAWERRE